MTGKRGIQIWVPVEPRYTYRRDERLGRGAVARGRRGRARARVSWDWAKSSRGGQARLDFTQNAVNKTLVAPYAVRPVRDAAVSAPITWDELDDPDLRPGRWNIDRSCRASRSVATCSRRRWRSSRSCPKSSGLA